MRTVGGWFHENFCLHPQNLLVGHYRLAKPGVDEVFSWRDRQRLLDHTHSAHQPENLYPLLNKHLLLLLWALSTI